MVFKCLTLKSVHGRRIFHTWKECEKLIADKKVNAQLVLKGDCVFPLSKYEDAFKAFLSGEYCKIMFDPTS